MPKSPNCQNDAPTLRIRADHLVTPDTAGTGVTTLENQSILVQNGRVARVEPGFSPKPGETVLDRGPVIAIPGLVNAHTHAAMTLFRGVADDLPLDVWLRERIWPLEAQLTPERTADGIRLACAEMLASGTTAFVDMYLWWEKTIAAVEEIGIRALVCEGILGFPTRTYQNADEAFALVRRLADRCQGNDRLSAGLAPHTVYTTDRAILEQAAHLSREWGLVRLVHAAETEHETAQTIDLYGKRPIDVLEETGFLGPGAWIVHGVDATPDEIQRVADSGTGLVHCPISNLKLGSGVADFPAWTNSGAPVALGTDGAASNNRLNLFAEMRFAALLAKGIKRDPTVAPAAEAFLAATVRGAQALGQPNLGRIAPGAPADIVLLSLNPPHMSPMTDPLSHLVYVADGSEVVLTMIGGDVLYDQGQFNTLDVNAVKSAAAGE